MAWTPSDIIALASIAATVVVGVTALVVNHRRELRIHQQDLEAERAKGYREQAVDIVALARNAAWECREVNNLPLPSTSEEATAYPRRAETAFGAAVAAQQAATRMAKLGWSEQVRSNAHSLDHALLGLSMSLSFPKILMATDIPEAKDLAEGDPNLWTRHQHALGESISDVEQVTREFEEAIGP